MGNHHGRSGHSKSGESTPTSTGSRKSITRTISGHDIPAEQQQQQQSSSEDQTDQQEQQAITTTQWLPIERLAHILSEKAHQEEGIDGIGLQTFSKYLFPRYPILAEKLYNYLKESAHLKTGHITNTAFKQQCEKYLDILDDNVIRHVFVKMYSHYDEPSQSDIINQDELRSLLMCAYHISMDHYSEGPQMCLTINKTLKSVVDGCFYAKQQLSVQFVVHWLEHNCPRLLFPLHRYIVHALATSYRSLEHSEPNPAVGLDYEVTNKGLELATPVLDKPEPFTAGNKMHKHLLQMSMSWLLAGALPPVYSRPQRINSPSNSGTAISSVNFLTKLLCAVPSHWVCLYDSNDMGLGENRFLHHVLSYRGPTLCLFQAENGEIFCVASPNEWKESHLYWGGEDSAVIQLFPKFAMLDKGSKMLYLNTMVRGYPHGLRAGRDPREPVIVIEAGFDKMQFRKIPYTVERIEVWGCGDPVSRETQLEIKRWEVKEAERQRCVKLSAADWLDHPDRYLLELAGRPQYHQNQTQ